MEHFQFTKQVKTTSLLLFAFVFFNVEARAEQKPAGKIVLAKGAVEIVDSKSKVVADSTGKSPRQVKSGAPFYQGETIRTKADGRVKIQFAEGGNEVVLGMNTALAIDRAGTGDGNKGTTLSLARGEVRSNVKTKYSGQGNDVFEVKTPNAVAGVRGTVFMSRFNAQTMKSDFATEKGAVAVASAMSNGAPVLVKAGMFVSAVPGGDVTPPKPIASNPEMAKAVSALSGGSNDAEADTQQGDGVGQEEKKEDKKSEDKKEEKKSDDKKEEQKGDSAKKDEGSQQEKQDSKQAEKSDQKSEKQDSKQADSKSEDKGSKQESKTADKGDSKEPAKNEPTKSESSKQETAKNEPAKQEPTSGGPTKQDSGPKQETASSGPGGPKDGPKNGPEGGGPAKGGPATAGGGSGPSNGGPNGPAAPRAADAAPLGRETVVAAPPTAGGMDRGPASMPPPVTAGPPVMMGDARPGGGMMPPALPTDIINKAVDNARAAADAAAAARRLEDLRNLRPATASILIKIQ